MALSDAEFNLEANGPKQREQQEPFNPHKKIHTVMSSEDEDSTVRKACPLSVIRGANVWKSYGARKD